ncbi:unnamed protein product [Ectocarpus sp. 12 AP-2014]
MIRFTAPVGDVGQLAEVTLSERSRWLQQYQGVSSPRFSFVITISCVLVTLLPANEVARPTQLATASVHRRVFNTTLNSKNREKLARGTNRTRHSKRKKPKGVLFRICEEPTELGAQAPHLKIPTQFFYEEREKKPCNKNHKAR